MNASLYSIPPGVSLIPLLKFEPYIFSNGSHELPPYPVSDEDMYAFWVACLADSGIVGLQPITIRSWHVSIDQLTDDWILELFIRKYMASLPSEDDSVTETLDPDNNSALNGGYALCTGGDVPITPQCCSSLADISDWKMAAEYRGADNTMVWIGHPWVNVRFNGINLIFTGDDGLTLKPSPECVVTPDDLKRAVDQAYWEIESLAERLTPVIEKFAPEGRAVETARILAGLQPFDDSL